MTNDDPRTDDAAAGGSAPASGARGGTTAGAGGAAGSGGKPGGKPGGDSTAEMAGKAAGGGAGATAPVFPPSPMNEKLATWREGTTTWIALLVVFVTLGMLVWTFLDADTADKKDIMLYGLPILGTVLGYYFGRVPAERRAESAEQGRGQAQATATHAVQEAASARETGEQHSRDKRDAERKLGVATAANESAKQSLAKVLGAPGAVGASGKPQRKTLGAGDVAAGETAGYELDAVREAYLELQAASRLL